jgi:uncharacterized protein (TIGR02246 family)
MISAEDEIAIRDLGREFEAAWNSHDMNALASPVTENVDFVHVRGGYLGGREVVRTYHAARHATQFRNSAHRTIGMSIRPPTPDICVAQVNWSNSGDTDPDGTPRQPREGLFTWIVRREGGGWLIDVAHNTNIDLQVVTAEYHDGRSAFIPSCYDKHAALRMPSTSEVDARKTPSAISP